jgi:SAM-dependent methyltransferase
MRSESYQLTKESEAKWWNQGRSFVVTRVLKKILQEKQRSTRRILDVGAGFGGMLEVLNPYGRVTALEPNEEARTHCLTRGYDSVLHAEDLSTLLPEGKEGYDLIAAFDVLEHVKDDRAFLEQAHDLLAPGGDIILTLPAFMFLWSEHDVINLHHRRYRCKEAVHLLHEVGFEVTYAGYWNMLLFFPAAIVRLLGHSGQSATRMPGFFDRLFFFVVVIESILVPFLRLPFGTSVIISGRKKP